MGVLRDGCFHQLGEPKVNGDPHEELIPPLQLLRYLIYHTAPLSVSHIEHPA